MRSISSTVGDSMVDQATEPLSSSLNPVWGKSTRNECHEHACPECVRTDRVQVQPASSDGARVIRPVVAQPYRARVEVEVVAEVEDGVHRLVAVRV